MVSLEWRATKSSSCLAGHVHGRVVQCLQRLFPLRSPEIKPSHRIRARTSPLQSSRGAELVTSASSKRYERNVCYSHCKHARTWCTNGSYFLQLRCDLVANDAVSSTCSRCQRLKLTCKIDNDFRRTRKRRYGSWLSQLNWCKLMARCFISRKSFELENEVRDLRRRLANREASSNAAVEWPILTPGAPCEYIETFLKKRLSS